MQFIKNVYYWLKDTLYLYRGVPRNINGTLIRFPAKWSCFFGDGYERDSFLFAANWVCPGDTVLDIGAHIGYFTIHLAKLTGPEGKVFAFEPTLFTRSILQKTVNLNKGVNVSVQPYAVSDQNGKAVFNVLPGNAGVANSMVAFDNFVPVEVKTIKIDTFRSDNNIRIKFIKIDVEGAEFFTLNGARQTFQVDRPHALLGLHPWQIRSMNTSLEQIWNLLIEYKMKISIRTVPVKKEWFIGQTELFDVELVPV